MRATHLLHSLRARPRLIAAIVFGAAVAALLPRDLSDAAVTRALIAWNAGTLLYILLAGVMMTRSSQESIQRRARSEDEGRHVVLVLVIVAVVASLAAIGGQLVVVKNQQGSARFMHVALAALTVLTSWAFVHLMFALHYAHDYYSDRAYGHTPGLAFPGKEKPGYSDFVYFAAIIGTSAQTADVTLTTQAMRRLGTLHCVLSFFFNTIVLALTINIAASLI